MSPRSAHRTFSDEDKKNLVKMFKDKPDYVKLSDFARSQGVNPNTFRTWTKQYG